MLCWKCSVPLPEGATFCGNCGAKIASRTPPPNILLERYEVIKEISHGKDSSLYQGRDLELGRPVALKVQHPQSPKEAALHLRREARILASLSHPCSFSVYSCEALSDGRVFLVLELIEGETLKTHTGALTDQEALELLFPLFGLIDHLHQKGFTHGDLSLSHLMLAPVPCEPGPILKLIGFDRAASLASNQASLPETLRLSSAAAKPQEEAKREDLLALASLTFELLNGHPPSQEELPPAPEDRPLIQAIKRALSHSGETTATALRQSFMEALSSAPPSEPAPEEPASQEPEEKPAPVEPEALQEETKPQPEEATPSASEGETRPQPEAEQESPPEEPAPQEEALLVLTQLEAQEKPEEPSSTPTNEDRPEEALHTNGTSEEPKPQDETEAQEKPARDEGTEQEEPVTARRASLKESYSNGAPEPSAPPVEERVIGSSEELISDRFLLLSEEPSVEMSAGAVDEVMQQLEEAVSPGDAPPSYAVLLRRADKLFVEKEWSEAFQLYREILAEHHEEQSTEELAEVLYRLGTIRKETGEREKAEAFYEKVLEVISEHKPSLLALREIYEETFQWGKAVAFTQRLLLLCEHPLERRGHLVKLGDILHVDLKEPDQAVRFYREALALNPEDDEIHRRLFALHFDAQQWAEAAEILERMVQLESNPATRAKLSYSLAALLHDELGQAERAAEYLNKALDDDYLYLKAFEKLEALLAQRRDYRGLERSYLRMLKRLPSGKEKELRLMLWSRLGELYQNQLHLPEMAIGAFEEAQDLDPENLERLEVLASLYELEPEHRLRAVECHRKLLEVHPERLGSLHALHRLYLKLDHFDKAFCLASALCVLQEASPEERSFYEQYRPKSLLTAKQVIDEESFEDLVKSPREDRYISAIFRLLSPYVIELYAQKEKEIGLKPKDRIDFNKTELMMPRRFQYVSKTLKIPVLVLYLQEGREGFEYEVVVVDKIPRPVVVIGQSLLSGKTDKEVVFLCAKNLAYLRGEYFLVRALKGSYATLKAVLSAAISMISPSAISASSDEAAVIQQLAQKLEQVLPSQALDQLETLVEEVLAAGRMLSISTWMKYAEISALRVALLLSNDLELSSRMASAETNRLSPLLSGEKVRELISYATSEEYFQLRANLGLSIS